MTIRHIDIDENYGAASGYVVQTAREQTGNYLGEYTEHANEIASWLRDNVLTVAILKNLNVNDEERGNGHGNSLVESFLDRAIQETASAVILIADCAESQREGFLLERWYEDHDFVSVISTGAGPVMVFPADLGLRMEDDLFSDHSIERGARRKPSL